MIRGARLLVATALLTAGCASSSVTFLNATPGTPQVIPAAEFRPAGSPGPHPAVVLLHGCHGVSDSTRAWARWFQARGYVALIVDSLTPRGLRENCSPQSPEIGNTARYDDAVGALRYLQARPYVDPARIGVIGWSNGGVFSIALVNGPSQERQRRRGVEIPPPGFRAAVAAYPGGCYSLVNERVVRPLLVLMGDADDWTIPGPCVQMVENMRAKGADASIVLYPGAYHYFDVAGQAKRYLTDVENRNLPGECCGATVAYDAAAAADAHRRIEAFFAQHLRPDVRQ